MNVDWAQVRTNLSRQHQRFWDGLAAQSRWAAYAAMAAMFGLSALCVGLFGWLWLADDIAFEALRGQRLRSSLAQQQALAATLPGLRQEQATGLQALAAQETALADGATAPALWLQVQAQALAQSIQVDSFQPGPSAVRAEYTELPVTVRLKGGYRALARWVADLAASAPALAVRRLSLQPSPDGQLLAEVTLLRYQRLAPSPSAASPPDVTSARPEASEPALSPAQVQALAQLSDPFADKAPAADADRGLPPHLQAGRPADPLQAWPLSDLLVVGTLVKHGQAVAWVQARGQVHLVRAGDYVGQDFGEVLRIEGGVLVLREWVRPSPGRWLPREVQLRVGSGKAS